MTDITPPDAPPEGSIHCEQRGALWLIGINRPAKRNGFTPAMFRQLGEAYTRLDDDADLRVGVLHAFGAHFTAGLDLPTIAPLMQRGKRVGQDNDVPFVFQKSGPLIFLLSDTRAAVHENNDGVGAKHINTADVFGKKIPGNMNDSLIPRHRDLVFVQRIGIGARNAGHQKSQSQ
jgi:hypothetical protein